MKEERITKVSLEEVKKITDKTNWERVKGMSEEEIERNALSDPDAQPTTEEFWEEAELIYPSDEGASQAQ